MNDLIERSIENKELMLMNLKLIEIKEELERKNKGVTTNEKILSYKKEIYKKEQELTKLINQKNVLKEKMSNIEIKYYFLQKAMKDKDNKKNESSFFHFEREDKKKELYRIFNDMLLTNNVQYQRFHNDNKLIVSNIIKVYKQYDN